MVTIIDSSERLRRESYEHINKLLAPNYFLRSAGTGADIYRGKCPTRDYELVGQWGHGFVQEYRVVGHMFLYWDNVEITIRGSPKMFYDVAVELEKHNYRVHIEV